MPMRSKVKRAFRQTLSAGARRVRMVTRYLPKANMIGTIHRTPSGIFSISSEDVALANALRNNQAWSQDEIDEIMAGAGAGSHILFVGAHVGTLVIPVAARVATVTAIEANPDTYRFLLANLAFNDVSNVTLHRFAAGEADGEIEFILSRQNSGGAKRRPVIADRRYTYDNPRIATVPMHRLDDRLTGPFDTIVMDIEGSEIFALRGMPRLLSEARRLFVEFLPHHLRNVAGADADALADLVLPHFPKLTVAGRSFVGEAARAELRRMYQADEDHDLIGFSRG